MAGATFGRKVVVTAEPVRRRADFLAPADSHADELARRKAAFLASERARAEQAVDHRDERPAPVSATSAQLRARMPGEKSVATAYLLWFFLSGLSGHRFYLGRPVTAVSQVALWYVSLVTFFLGHYWAFYVMVGGWLWIFSDAFLIPQMVRDANEKLRARRAPIE